MSAVDFLTGDCLEILPGFPSGSFDVAVTSPPYNLGVEYSSGIDDARSTVDYLTWTGRWLREVRRVLADEGSLFLNVGGKPTDPLMMFRIALAASEVFHVQNVIYWTKAVSIETKDCWLVPKDGEQDVLSADAVEGDVLSAGHYKPINSPRFVNDCVEHVLHLTKTGDVPIDRKALGVPFVDKSNLKRGTRGRDGDLRCRGNAWFCPYSTIQSREGERPHPASFPPRLAEMCYRLHGTSRIRRGTLDPFSGIGSSARAAWALGVSHVGIELSEEDNRTAARLLGEDQAAYRAARGGAS